MKKIVKCGAATALIGAAGVTLYSFIHNRLKDGEPKQARIPSIKTLEPIDHRIYEHAKNYQNEAVALLKELIRLPVDIKGQNIDCVRIQFLKQRIIELGAVRRPQDITIDEFGNLCWFITDSKYRTPIENRRVIYFAGHIDTSSSHPSEWTGRIGLGMSPYNGLTDMTQVDEAKLRKELSYLPRHEMWNQLVFGRGSVSQLQGIVTQIYAMKILLEIDALEDCYIYSIISPKGLEHPGSGLQYATIENASQQLIPDAVILTTATGSVNYGPLALAVGHKNQTVIEVTVSGSGSGKIGKNPLECGSRIISEASSMNLKVAWARAENSSEHDSAYFTFRLVSRDLPIHAIEKFSTIKRARADGFDVHVEPLTSHSSTWTGFELDAKKEVHGWITPSNSPAINAALEAYQRIVTPHVVNPTKDTLQKTLPLRYWNGISDGVGLVFKKDEVPFSILGKHWIEDDKGYVYPPMFGIGAGYEEHQDAIGEYVNGSHLWGPIAVMTRFSSIFRP